MDAQEFRSRLTSLLTDFGSAMTESSIRRSTKECRDAIYADILAQGGKIEDPFFNFVARGDLAVFTFFESQFSLYVVPCNETELIAETERFAMADTEECKAFLAARFNKVCPDLVLTRQICEYWLDGN
jgi:hypothetical protein